MTCRLKASIAGYHSDDRLHHYVRYFDDSPGFVGSTTYVGGGEPVIHHGDVVDSRAIQRGSPVFSRPDSEQTLGFEEDLLVTSSPRTLLVVVPRLQPVHGAVRLDLTCPGALRLSNVGASNETLTMTGFNMRGGTGVMTIVGGIQSSLLVQRTFGSQRVVFDWCSRQTDETIHLIHPSGSREWASHRLNSPMLAQVVAQHAGGQGLYRLYANRTTGPMGATFAVFAGLDPYPNLDAVTLALQAADAS